MSFSVGFVPHCLLKHVLVSRGTVEYQREQVALLLSVCDGGWSPPLVMQTLCGFYHISRYQGTYY